MKLCERMAQQGETEMFKGQMVLRINKEQKVVERFHQCKYIIEYALFQCK